MLDCWLRVILLMNTFFIFDNRTLNFAQFDLDASQHSYHRNVMYEFMRYTVISEQALFLKKTSIILPNVGDAAVILPFHDYIFNLRVILETNISSQAYYHHQYLLNALNEIHKYIYERKDHPQGFASVMIVFFTHELTFDCSLNMNKDVLLIIQILRRIRSLCFQFEFRYSCTVIKPMHELDGTRRLLKEMELTMTNEWNNYGTASIGVDETNDIGYSFSTAVLHNSPVHLREEFRLLISKQYIPISSVLTWPSQSLSIDLELAPASITSADNTHAGLEHLQVSHLINAEGLNPGPLCFFKLIRANNNL